MANLQQNNDIYLQAINLKKDNIELINTILKDLQSMIFEIGSKGGPDLLKILEECNLVNDGVNNILQGGPDAPADSKLLASLTEKFEDAKKEFESSPRSNSYLFYVDEERNELSAEGKRIEELKTSNLDNLKIAYKLYHYSSAKNVIESSIKINKTLCLLPRSTEKINHSKILDDLSKNIEQNTKSIEFMSTMKTANVPVVIEEHPEESQPI